MPNAAAYGSWKSPITSDLVAQSITLSEARFDGEDVYWLEGRVEELPRERPIVIYCICGFQLSGTAVTKLRERGYDARALVGGITAWHAIGGTTAPLDTTTFVEVP